MAKDYAKRVYSTSRKPKKKRVRVELWLVPLILITFLIIFVGYQYRTAIRESNQSWFSHFKALISHKKSTAPVVTKTAVAQNDQETVHFEFYSTLPKMKVTVPKSEEPAATVH